MSNKALFLTLAVALFTLMMSCNDSGPGKIDLEITAVSPDSGSIGTEVTISGSGFVPKASENIVKFNDTEAEVISVTSDKIVTKVPVGATSGPIVIEVGNKEVTGPSFIITDVNGGSGAPPSIDSLNPTEGPVQTAVTISGSNFSPIASENIVTFGDIEVPVSAASTNELTAIVPEELSPGMLDVRVAVDEQTALAPDQFTVTQDDGDNTNNPSIGDISPTEGTTGTEVTITGENFSPTPGDNTVTFNGTEATISSASETELVAVVPEGTTSGPVAITVDGKTAIGPNFTITDDGGSGGGNAPSIGGISPTEGTTGTEVTISGENFSSTPGDNTVTFDGTEATVNSATETELVAVVPEGATTGPVAVTVGGQAATGPEFTVTDDGGGGGANAPSIDSINPTEGEAGTAVTITGSNFGATASDNTVEFGGSQATINSASSSEIVAVVPDGLGAGVVDVTVTTNGQTATAPDQFTVTVPSPVIDAIDPTSGVVGTEVTITGSNFGSTVSENTVTFGDTEATINSASETEIVAVVPNSLSPGAHTVEVTVNGQMATDPDFTVLEEGTPQFPIIGSNATIDHGPVGGCGGCGMTNEANIIDSNTETNHGQVEISLGVSGGYYVSVESAGNIPAGGEAGFVVANQGDLIGIDLLESITITTYLNGTEQESVSGAALLNLELVSGTTDQQFVSFTTGSEFDEIEIEFGGLVSASATYEVYAAYGGMEADPVPGPAINLVSPERGPEGTEVTITGSNFSATASENTVSFDGVQATNIISASETELVVEVPTGATTGPLDVLVNGQTATYSDFVVGAIPLTGNSLTAETGIVGVCLGCSDSGGSNVIDEDQDNFASIELTAGVGATGYVSIENQDNIPAGGQAGFLVARSGGTIDLDLLGNITVATYLNGTLQESQSGSNLLLLDLLAGTSTDRQFIGFETTQEYDEIRITFSALVSADILYEIYGVYDDYFVTE